MHLQVLRGSRLSALCLGDALGEPADLSHDRLDVPLNRQVGLPSDRADAALPRLKIHEFRLIWLNHVQNFA